MAVSACSADQGDVDPPAGAPAGGVSNGGTAVVERRDISSVLVLDAAAVAFPEFAVSAPQAGEFTRAKPVKKAVVIKAGGRLGSIRRAGRTYEVVTPVAATVVSIAVADGAGVQPGLPLMVLKAGGFAMRAEVSQAQQYRLNDLPGTAQSQIENGPGPFPCPVLGFPATEGGGTADGGPIAVLCGAPPDLRLFPGLRGVVALNTGTAKNVPTLPVEAVAGTVEQGRVTLRGDDGAWQDRDVTLGLTDGSYVQVRQGLEVGATVRVPGPDLPQRN